MPAEPGLCDVPWLPPWVEDPPAAVLFHKSGGATVLWRARSPIAHAVRLPRTPHPTYLDVHAPAGGPGWSRRFTAEKRFVLSARKKLNAAHVLGCLVVAALVGLLANSWFVFLCCLATLLAADLIAGNIRPPGK